MHNECFSLQQWEKFRQEGEKMSGCTEIIFWCNNLVNKLKLKKKAKLMENILPTKVHYYLAMILNMQGALRFTNLWIYTFCRTECNILQDCDILGQPPSNKFTLWITPNSMYYNYVAYYFMNTTRGNREMQCNKCYNESTLWKIGGFLKGYLDRKFVGYSYSRTWHVSIIFLETYCVLMFP